MLEAEVGFPLFERTGHGINVTYPSRTFLHQAEQAVNDLQRLSDTAGQLRGKPVGSIRIGFSTGLAQGMIPWIMRDIGQVVPQPRLEATTATTRRVQRLVFQERLDLGLTIEVGARSVPPDLLCERVGALALGLLVPPDYGLARGNDSIAVSEFADEPLILNEPDIGFGEFFKSIFADHGLQPTIAAVLDSMETLKLMVQSGLGIVIVPINCAMPVTETSRFLIRAISPPCAVPVTLIFRDGPHEFPVNMCIEIILRGLADVSAEGG